MKTVLGAVFVLVFAGFTVRNLVRPGGEDEVFVGLVGLALTIVVAWRERFPNGLSYVLIALGMLRTLFPVAMCVSHSGGEPLLPAYLPWDCDVQVRPVAGITAVQAIFLIGVGAWWLWWRKVGAESSSGHVWLRAQESRRAGPLVSTPSSEQAMSEEEARLADAGSRKLFNKPLSALIEDFERVGNAPTWELIDMLVQVGRRELAKSSS